MVARGWAWAHSRAFGHRSCRISLGVLRIELQTFHDYPFIEVLEALKMDELCVPEGANSERVTVSGPT